MRHPKLMRMVAFGVAAAAMFGLVVLPGVAGAQEPPQITPNFSVTPSKTVTPWIYQMAIGAIILGVIIVVAVTVSYLRFSPKFFGKEEAPARTPPGTRPPLARPTPQQRQAVPAPSPAPAPATPAAPALATATAVFEAPLAPPEPEPPAPADPTPTPAPVPRAESALDQETFDRVLQEQLDKGMDRRVAEGRARAAAVVAARKKAQG